MPRQHRNKLIDTHPLEQERTLNRKLRADLRRARKALGALMKILENDAFDPIHYEIWQTAKKERDEK